MSRSGLESAVGAPAQTWEGKDLFPDIPSKAACLFRSLIKNHPFLEGNKRTAVVCTDIFCQLNGFRLGVEQDELYALAIRVALSSDNEAILKVLIQWFGARLRRYRRR